MKDGRQRQKMKTRTKPEKGKIEGNGASALH
jgi:hypothetical protein